MPVQYIKDISIHILKQEDIPYLRDLYTYPLTSQQVQFLYSQLTQNITYGIYTNQLIGIIQLYEKEEGIYEVGYRIKKQEMHQGYMTKGLQLLLDELQKKNIKKLYAKVDERNIASRKVLENTGFLQEVNKDGVLIYACAYEG